MTSNKVLPYLDFKIRLSDKALADLQAYAKISQMVGQEGLALGFLTALLVAIDRGATHAEFFPIDDKLVKCRALSIKKDA